jgi:hypothetical protein
MSGCVSVAKERSMGEALSLPELERFQKAHRNRKVRFVLITA